jgi:hypothetical protein
MHLGWALEAVGILKAIIADANMFLLVVVVFANGSADGERWKMFEC